MPEQEVEYLQKNDIGTILKLIVLDEDQVVVNIDTATLLEIKWKKPVTETVFTKTAAIFDGPNGVMSYTLISGDADEVGLFEIQGYVELPLWRGHTDIESFYVKDNLGATKANTLQLAFMEGT